MCLWGSVGGVGELGLFGRSRGPRLSASSDANRYRIEQVLELYDRENSGTGHDHNE
jgi:hypothetical protein